MYCREGRPYTVQARFGLCPALDWFPWFLRRFHACVPTIELYVSLISKISSDIAVRFMGIKENAAEVKRDMEELSALAKAGKPVYGETDLPEYIQGVANRNSAYSQFKLQTIPWCVFILTRWIEADEPGLTL
jgi:hypothetical protein